MRYLPSIVLLLSLGTLANAQNVIGKATTVQPQARGTVAGNLSTNSSVHEKETIQTETEGQAGLQFHDNSNLKVGPKSSVKLDKFVYNPNKGTGETVIEATRGTFRFSTGAAGQPAKIKTPYGMIGTRG